MGEFLIGCKANLYANFNNFGGGGGGGRGGEEEATMFCWFGKCHLFGRHGGDFLPIETWRLFLRFPARVPGASVGNNVFSVTDANEGGRRHRHHPPPPLPPVHQGALGVMDEYLKPLPLQIRRDLEVDGTVPRSHLKRASFALKAPPPAVTTPGR